MADRRLLTDRYLRALPPAPQGQRVEVFDARLPGFGLRITDAVDADPARRGKAGKISFILFTRFSPGAAPTRRVIGTYGAVSLEDARRTAGEWRSLIARGIDPAVIEAEVRAMAARERAARIKHSFANVAEAFVTDKLRKERSGRVAERDLRGVFVKAWADRPVSEITKLDVLEIINTKKRTAPQTARCLLVLAKRFFGWAVDQQTFGLSVSPCEGLSGKKLIGELRPRDRRLRQREIDDFNLAELRRRRLELHPEPKEKPQPQRTVAMDKHNATATYVTWRQLEEFSSFLGAELGKAESRANTRIKALEADVAALKCELAIVHAHKMSKPVAAEGSITSLRNRSDHDVQEAASAVVRAVLAARSSGDTEQCCFDVIGAVMLICGDDPQTKCAVAWFMRRAAQRLDGGVIDAMTLQ